MRVRPTSTIGWIEPEFIANIKQEIFAIFLGLFANSVPTTFH